MKKLLAAALLLSGGLSMSAHAGFISGNFTLSNGNTVDLQGLEWMPLTYTGGMSRVDIEDGFTDRFGNIWNASDWRYATRSETSILLNSLAFTSGYHANNHAGAKWFMESFGYTIDSTWYQKVPDYTSFGTQFYFGETGSCGTGPLNSNKTCVGRVSVSMDSRDTVGYFGNEYGLSLTSQILATNDVARIAYGSLLVRTQAITPAPTVSEPSVIGLLGLALCGMFAANRRKKLSS